MRTTNILATSAACIALLLATPANALDRPVREVRINAENLAKLPPEQQQRVLEIKNRLEELMAVDRTAIDPSDRAAMRSELKALKREMKAHNRDGTVIYLSTAGIIIILLILIILL